VYTKDIEDEISRIIALPADEAVPAARVFVLSGRAVGLGEHERFNNWLTSAEVTQHLDELDAYMKAKEEHVLP
jgi:hypothetical protein